MRYTIRLIGHRVSRDSGLTPKVGRGRGAVLSLPPVHADRNTPAAAAAERVMNSRRVSRLGYTNRIGTTTLYLDRPRTSGGDSVTSMRLVAPLAVAASL